MLHIIFPEAGNTLPSQVSNSRKCDYIIVRLNQRSEAQPYVASKTNVSPVFQAWI
jgi:hypothetical protein